MAHTSVGSLLAKQRWQRPENVARRVARLVREIESIAPALTAEQRAELHAAAESQKAAA